MIEYTANDVDKYILTKEGTEILQNGSHEVRVFNAIPATGGLLISDLTVFLIRIKIVIIDRHLWVSLPRLDREKRLK